jgi:mannose-6-phosphate isomerase
MDRIRPLRNPIRDYAWGSRTALAELLGEPVPAPHPQAELWMGAHPLAPSEVRADSGWTSLADWIGRDPETVLGPEAARGFGGALPFLLKLLAAERPLSIQAHPDAEQARAGFERENAAGIPLEAPQRSYRDPNAKPELLCALTPFAALCGFRGADEIVAQLDELRAQHLIALSRSLRLQRDRAGLERFFGTLLNLDAGARSDLVTEVAEAAKGGCGDPQVRGWIRTLAEEHPGDSGVLSPLFLNLVELQPGEAIFLPPRELHSYLRGVGVEIMASSDNVLRGGLTSKHVDAAELLAILSFDSRRPPILAARAVCPLESVYDAPAREFQLGVLRPRPDAAFESARERSVEILFCAQGEARLEDPARGEITPLPRGAAVLVAAAVPGYRLRGDATVFRAAVPLRGR